MSTDLIAQYFGNPYLFYAIVIWSLVWKGLALWKSARRGEKYWFIALLVINIIGLFEMLYIFVITPWIDSRKNKKTDVSNS
jgi:hypothetical protein